MSATRQKIAKMRKYTFQSGLKMFHPRSWLKFPTFLKLPALESKGNYNGVADFYQTIPTAYLVKKAIHNLLILHDKFRSIFVRNHYNINNNSKLIVNARPNHGIL